MIRLAARLALVASAFPASAQDHSGHLMPALEPHTGHAMSAAGAAPAPQAAEPVGTDLEPGSSPAPPPPTDRYADRFWPAEAMAAARAQVQREHGAMTTGMVMLNIAELQPTGGPDRYRWDAEGWWGGDIHRLTIKTEGGGAFDHTVREAEIQALYSRAIDAYWNLQAGIRQDLGAGARRPHATVGVEGLAPYWFEVEGALFLSSKGDLSGRIEAYYDQRLTQRLVLQPRAEINVAFQDVPGNGTGHGLSDTSLDLRLRYEVRREFAPYVGVSWSRKIGRTARFARAAGEDRNGARLALGLRAWF